MYKLIFLSLLIFLSIYFSIDIRCDNFKQPDYINVEIKGDYNETFKMPFGSNMNDLLMKINNLDNYNLENISLNSTLYNNQIINLSLKKISDNNLISINSASIEDLIKLPGIGYSTAQKIIDYRLKIGSFISIDDIKNVKGIGEKKYKSIKKYICL